MKELLDELRLKLQRCNIYALRQVGREAGVDCPTKKKKDELLEDILAIASGEAEPCGRDASTRGAPPKDKAFDADLVEEVRKCRALCESMRTDISEREESEPVKLRAETSEQEDETYSGVLEYTDKFWFLRTQNMQISSQSDVFVHSSFVNRFRLKSGDFVVCRARRRRENECPGATFIVSVNGVAPDKLRRQSFEKLIPCYPDKRYELSAGGGLCERLIDLFSPVGYGQRALIVSPPKAGKTTMLKTLACALTRNYPQSKVIILLVDERPEEVTDIMRSVDGAEVVYSTFDRGDSHHIHVANLALERAKRLVEMGTDVIILMDSITRLTRAYNAVCNSGRILSGGLDPQALVEPKRFFGAARNIENGGSLTIVATALVNTGSKLDDVIYEEFKSTGNMEIVLSRDLAERRIFPAIDLKASGARKEDLLLSEDELAAVYRIRRLLGKELTQENLYSTMERTKDNKEFCEKSQAFLNVYINRN